MNFKKTLLAVGLFLASTAAFAQDENASAPYWFTGVQGGVQVYPLNGSLKDLWTPHYGIHVGRQVSDVFGMRLQALGYESKGLFEDNSILGEPGTYTKYKVWSAKWDVLLNVTQILFPHRTNKSFNWNVFLGAGATGAFDTPEYSDKVALYPGVGTQVEYLFTKNFGINLEVQANHKAMTLNSLDRGNQWQGVAFLGLTCHFGHAKAKKAEPVVVEPVYATRVDTVWYNDTEYKTRTVTQEFSCDDHFQIAKSEPVSESVVTKVTDFVKQYKNVAVSVTGYADKGTGTAEINQKLSQQRAEAVADALKAAGVSADIITVDWKGDTVQPFADNDANRAAIVKLTGETEEKYPVEIKKYRTEQVRYQVQ